MTTFVSYFLSIKFVFYRLIVWGVRQLHFLSCFVDVNMTNSLKNSFLHRMMCLVVLEVSVIALVEKNACMEGGGGNFLTTSNDNVLPQYPRPRGFIRSKSVQEFFTEQKDSYGVLMNFS